jgi:hypothetical protein
MKIDQTEGKFINSVHLKNFLQRRYSDKGKNIVQLKETTDYESKRKHANCKVAIS